MDIGGEGLNRDDSSLMRPRPAAKRSPARTDCFANHKLNTSLAEEPRRPSERWSLTSVGECPLVTSYRQSKQVEAFNLKGQAMERRRKA
jgi:hypothetical protein